MNVLGSYFGGWGFNNLYLKKSPGGAGGKGPVLAPAVLTPSEAQALLPGFTDEVLREEPFFRPGGFWTKVGSWLPNDSGGRALTYERIGALYGATGSAFAARHHDTLLARMMPVLSLVAGQDAVEKFVPQGSSAIHNFNINDPTFRGTALIPRWPANRGDNNPPSPGIGISVRASKKVCHSERSESSWIYAAFPGSDCPDGFFARLRMTGRVGFLDAFNEVGP